MMCADLAALGSETRALVAAGINGFHFDIMDGRFVPNLALSPDHLAALRPLTTLPFDAHLMVCDPVPLVARLADTRCNVCTIHIESAGDPVRAIEAIRAHGMRVGLALSPSTSLARLAGVLPLVDHVLVMTVRPGFAGQAMISDAGPRVHAVAELIRASGRPAALAVDGNVSPETVGRLVRAGAGVLVGGSSGLFLPGVSRADALARLRRAAHDR